MFVVVLRFLYSFSETDFFGVVRVDGGRGDFLDSSDGVSLML